MIDFIHTHSRIAMIRAPRMNRTLNTWVILISSLICSVLNAQPNCEGQVMIQVVLLDDLIIPDSVINGAVVGQQAEPRRRKDQEGFEYGLPEHASHQVLALHEGFRGEVSVLVNDSLYASGSVQTNDAIGSTGFLVDLGDRGGVKRRVLRIEYGNQCMETLLDQGHPIVIAHQYGGQWLLEYTDHWPVLE